jgi:hypothetical protein
MNINIKGRSLELYFIDGRPDGMLTAEVFNWTGHVLVTPRTQIGAALAEGGPVHWSISAPRRTGRRTTGIYRGG